MNDTDDIDNVIIQITGGRGRVGWGGGLNKRDGLKIQQSKISGWVWINTEGSFL